MRRAFLIVLAIAWSFGPVSAQLTYLDLSANPTVGLEVSRAFVSDSGLKWYTSVVRGRALIPVADRAHLIADLGISLAGTESGSDATFANPEIGVGFSSQEGETRFKLTTVLPLGFGLMGDDDASVATGFLSDVFRPDLYADELVSVNAGFMPRAALGERTEFMADVYLSAMIPTGDGDTEFFSRYTVGLHQEVGRARVRGALEGLAILSESGLTFSERTLHRILLGIEGAQGGPGLFVRIPIDDQLDDLDWSVGLTFTF